MNELINDIYSLTEDAIITPRDLVDNIKLANYKKISYESTNTNGLKCEMITENDAKDEVIFNYYFDDKDFLIYVEAIENSVKTVMFNRSEKLNILLDNYDSAVASSEVV